MSALDQTALSRDAWAQVCTAIDSFVGAKGTAIVTTDVSRHTAFVPHSETLTEAIQHALTTGWHQRDFRLQSWPAHVHRGLVRDQDLIDPASMRRHPYFAEFLRFGLLWNISLLFRIEGDVWGVSVNAGPERGEPFEEREAELLLQLRRPLLLALKRAHVLGRQRLATIEEIFSPLQRGVVALDWSGRVLHASPKAEALLGPANVIRDGYITHDDARLRGRLTALVHSAIKTQRSDRGLLPHPIVMPRDGVFALSLDAIPMPRDFQALAANCAALLTIHEIEPQERQLGALLKQGFGLTQREMELVLELTKGTRLDESAGRLGMSTATARHHLKAIFAKTGTNRQSELVALLTSRFGTSI